MFCAYCTKNCAPAAGSREKKIIPSRDVKGLVKNLCPGRIIRKGYPLSFLHVSFSVTRTVYRGLRGFQGSVCHGVKRGFPSGIPELAIAPCRKKIYPLRAPGSRWPGEKKGRFKGFWLKSRRNQAFQGNRQNIGAEISPWLALLKRVNS